MKTTRLYAAALLGALTITAIAPVVAQSGPPKPSKQERKAMTKSQRAERKVARKMEKGNMMNDNMNNTMTSDAMAPSMMNNTAVVQGNIDRANQTLNGMVTLLNQIDARKRPGATTTP